MSKDNDLCDNHMDIIAEYLGPEFSAEKRREAAFEMKMVLETAKSRESAEIPEQYNFGVELNGEDHQHAIDDGDREI